MRNDLFMLITILIGSANVQAQVPQFSDIARNADGSVRYMNQPQAVTYCSHQGMHLPSARDLAEFSTSLGAQGIKELSDFPSDAAAFDAGYYRVYAQNPNNGIDDNFYFNPKGYNRPGPADKLGDYWNYFWSTSVFSGHPNYAYYFDGGIGGFDDVSLDLSGSFNYAVFCALSP